jgi:predicted transcriptional regulator
MKDTTLTIRLESDLRAKIESRAKRERRSLANESAYLMEIGLSFLERQSSTPDNDYQYAKEA